tara:strand:- start:4000 stop:4836 length:837 start_codon:yes stop_codon:yes gene_type:complete
MSGGKAEPAKPSQDATLAELSLRNQELQSRYVLEAQRFEEVCDEIDELNEGIDHVRERLQIYCVMPEFKARNARNRGFGATNVTTENQQLVHRTVSVLESNAQTVTIRLNTVKGYNADLAVQIEMREKELVVNTAYEERLAKELTVAQAERSSCSVQSKTYERERREALQALAAMKDRFEGDEREMKATLAELSLKLSGGGKKAPKFGRGGGKKKKKKGAAGMTVAPVAASVEKLALSPARIVQQRRMRRGKVAAAAAAAAERQAAEASATSAPEPAT